MVKAGFDKFYWGFLFIMFDFRIQGIDILPDVIGFILFAVGFQTLLEHSSFFAKGKTYNLIMLIISIFSIYERPTEESGIHINPFGILLGLVSFALILAVAYHLFMGIKEMAEKREQPGIAEEAIHKWKLFLAFQIATLFLLILIFLPPLFILAVIVLFVFSIALMIILMRFMKVCGEQLDEQ